MLNRIINNEGSGTGEWTLLSRIIWLKATVLAAAGAAWKTMSGAIVQFVTERAHALKELVVTLEPQQDLHGYDSPWPAGGGVNFLPPMVDGTYEGNGVKAVVKNGIATLSGTTTASGNAFSIPLAEEITIPSGTTFYYHIMNSEANGLLVPSIEPSNSTLHALAYAATPANRISAAITADENWTYGKVRFWLNNNVTISGTYSPMLCKDNTARSYSPYSNICPISGWTGCEVWRTGENLLDPGEMIEYGSGAGKRWYYDDGFTLKANQPYTFSVTYDTPPIYLYIINKATGEHLSEANNVVRYTPAEDTTVYFQAYKSSGMTDAYMFKLELGSTATAYEEYRGNSYSVTFGETVYGGDVDVIDGVGKGERNNAVFDGTENVAAYGNLYVCAKTFPKGTGNYLDFLCSHAPTDSYVNYANASKNTFQFTASYFGVSTVEEFKAFLAEQNANGTPVTINYPLDTSTEFETTPTPITALKGYNAVWSDGGDVTVAFRGTPIEEPDAEPLQALNLLLGGAYRNDQTPEDVPDDEALDILLGGADR